VSRESFSIKGEGRVIDCKGEPPFQFGLDEGEFVLCSDCGAVLCDPTDGVKLHPDLTVLCEKCKEVISDV
jgi:hypothetical protein